MSAIKAVYENAPSFPATDQHPDAVRYKVTSALRGSVVVVDAVGGEPTIAEVDAILNPPKPELTPEQKLERAGLTVDDLKALLK